LRENYRLITTAFEEGIQIPGMNSRKRPDVVPLLKEVVEFGGWNTHFDSAHVMYFNIKSELELYNPPMIYLNDL
jgi:hypothetical protein